MSAVDLSVVVPVYRSAATLPELFDRLLRVLKGTGGSFEMIFVDDGSPDDSWEVLSRLHRQAPDVVVAVGLMRNFGQHNALMAGFRHARGEVVVTLDDDLQNPPEEIPKLLAALQAGGFDVVYGAYRGKQHSWWRNLASALVTRFFRVALRTRVTPTSFRAVRRAVLAGIDSYRLNFTVVDGLLAWNTQRIGAAAVEHHARQAGRSGYSLGKLLVQALNVLTNFSLLPLQFVSLLGLVTAVGGLSLAGFYLVRYLSANISVPGYASTIIAILVLGGVQLLSLGIIGEYIGRILLNINQKPQYLERHVLRSEDQS
jgi:undecaprenyl-phosphate 4-deoxy-4-formamido-L-arabinose transferase